MQWGSAWVVRRRLGRAGPEGVRPTWVTSTVFVEVPVPEVAAEGGFRQRSATCRIRGVGGRKWHEDVPR